MEKASGRGRRAGGLCVLQAPTPFLWLQGRASSRLVTRAQTFLSPHPSLSQSPLWLPSTPPPPKG